MSLTCAQLGAALREAQRAELDAARVSVHAAHADPKEYSSAIDAALQRLDAPVMRAIPAPIAEANISLLAAMIGRRR